MHVRIILMGIIRFRRKKITVLVNIKLLNTRNDTIGNSLLANIEVNMNQNPDVIRWNTSILYKY